MKSTRHEELHLKKTLSIIVWISHGIPFYPTQAERLLIFWDKWAKKAWSLIPEAGLGPRQGLRRPLEGATERKWRQEHDVTSCLWMCMCVCSSHCSYRMDLYIFMRCGERKISDAEFLAHNKNHQKKKWRHAIDTCEARPLFGPGT